MHTLRCSNLQAIIYGMDAYLDIETTGLSAYRDQITVVGIYITDDACSRLVQLVGGEVTPDALCETLDCVKTLYTYNGSAFDLPFIYIRHKVNLAKEHQHKDLMYACHRCNLYGGLKSVEQQLGIERCLKEVNGAEAVRLWWQYENNYDKSALETLLKYNAEDVQNLRTLREKLSHIG